MVRIKAAEFAAKQGITGMGELAAGKTWYYGFIKRHDLSLRQPSKITTQRGRCMERKRVNEYFECLRNVLDGVPEECIWNMDECGFNFEHVPSKVLVAKGERSVNARVSGGRENTTIVACASASGKVLPPFVIIKGKTRKALNAYQTKDAPIGSVFSWQAKAWMEDDLAPKWFESVFLKYTDASRPQVLILDQHHSHESFDFLHLAREHNVTIIALPPHTTHWLQPLDKGCFSSLSSNYHAADTELMCAEKSNVVTISTFLSIFATAWRSSMT